MKNVKLLLLLFLIILPACKEKAHTELQKNPRAYKSCTNKDNDIAAYAVVAGRSLSCGIDVQEQTKYVEEWIDDCYSYPDNLSQKVFFHNGLKISSDKQSCGESPETCETLRKSLATWTWPDNSRNTTNASDTSNRTLTAKPGELPDYLKSVPVIDKKAVKAVEPPTKNYYEQPKRPETEIYKRQDKDGNLVFTDNPSK